MISLKNSVVDPLSFDKVATLKLPKDTMEWNDKILQQFYEEHNTIDKGSNASVIVNNIDDKLGYAKGSVVVWSGDNKINFPVIINEWKLDPFDVFVTPSNEYVYATESDISKALTSEDLGKTVGSSNQISDDIVSPGNINHKESVKIASNKIDWKDMVNKGDLDNVTSKITGDPRLATKNIIDTLSSISPIGNTGKSKLSISGSIIPKTSKTITSLDAEDMSLLREVPKNSKCVIKVDVSGFGKISSALDYAAKGYSVPGYVLGDSASDSKVFISEDGKQVAFANTFYGTGITPCDNVKSLVSSVTSNDVEPGKCSKLLFILDDDYASIRDKYTKRVVNGKSVYVGSDIAIVVSDVKKPIIVSEIDDPATMVAIGDRSAMLIPGNTLVVNTDAMEDISTRTITPDYSMIDALKAANVDSVSVGVGENGISIKGDVVKKLEKVASLSGSYSVSESMMVLQTIGMTKEASRSVIGNVINNSGNSVEVFGVNDDYINTDELVSMRKTAGVNSILGEYANSIKVDLLKEASVIDDPTVVDRVLSLNFINKDNIVKYIKFKDELEESSGVLAELIVASRLGLKDVDEGAVKKALEGINSVVDGLNKLKLIIDS